MRLPLSSSVLAWCIAGCAALPSVAQKEPLDEHIVVRRGDESELAMEVQADSARLTVEAGDCDYVEIRAKYETEGVQPEVAYTMATPERALIQARERRRTEGKHYGLWKICVDGDTPVDLETVAQGGTFRLSELQIHQLEIDGQGRHVELDMLEVKHPMQITVKNDGGTIGLKLPTSAAFEMDLERSDRVKYMHVDGLRRRDDGRYVGTTAGADVAKIELRIDGTPHGVAVRKKNFRGKWR